MAFPTALKIGSGLPRLGVSIVQRQRLEDWLERFRSVPVRFLVAPPGFGKTMVLLGYLRNSTRNGRYCLLPPGCGAQAFWGAVGRALQLEDDLTSHARLLDVLRAQAPLELAIDCEGVPGAEGVLALLQLIEDLPDGVSLLIAGRSCVTLHVGRFVLQGTAVLCDAERLAFDAAGIQHVAENLGVPFTHADVNRMLEATDGWPQVVSGALRKAAEDDCSLAQAFVHWQRHHGHLFDGFIGATLKQVSERDAALVVKLMSGSHLDDRLQLEGLEEQGLFVVHTPGGYRPLRALSQSRSHNRHEGRLSPVIPMQVRLLGWFSAELDQQPIEWVRRRDCQIFKYVALQPNGSVSRAELGQVFWPHTEQRLMARSLRTACSNIRKAIANIVGFEQVDAYFRIGHDLSIDLDNVIIDVNCFIRHANDADEQYDHGALRVAHASYQNAARIYRGDLLIGDAHEPWVASRDAALQERHVMVLRRIAEIEPSSIITGPESLILV